VVRVELRSKESTWLFGIALNVARNQRAKEQRQRLLRRLFFRPEPTAPLTSVAVEARSRLSAVLRAVHALPTALREAYVVRVLEEQPLKEAAVLLGVPLSTVAEWAARAEALVRAAVENANGSSIHGQSASNTLVARLDSARDALLRFALEPAR
jgi:RNA polymerase sigma-70 factor (ECF subfamily)